jgi:hypothetical protein
MRFKPADLLPFLGAGLVSSAMAGITGMFLTAIAIAGSDALAAFIFIPHAALVGVRWTGATALVLGTLLSVLGARRLLLRRRSTWVATGIAAAVAHYFLPWPDSAHSFASEPVLRAHSWLLPLIFVLSGAAAALSFRATMQFDGRFLPDEDEGEA